MNKYSKVWMLDGVIDSIPGILGLADDVFTLSLVGTGTYPEKKLCDLGAEHDKTDLWNLLSKEEAPVVELFRFKAGEISGFKSPWYYFSGGINISVGERQYRFSFVQPQNTKMPALFSRSTLGEVLSLGGEVSLSAGRKAGKEWKAMLSELVG